MARRRLEDNLADAAISTITEAELRFGLAKRPEAVKLRKAVESFLSVITVLSWDSEAARAYGVMRAKMMSSGKTLSALDLLIAAHATALDSVLVTSDKAFEHAEGVSALVNWATDI
jgi:tRNA(fMet)-specific endonuclease VapC